jgi:hypothetical protein
VSASSVASNADAWRLSILLAASYKYRRDYAQVVNGTWALKRLQALPLEQAQAGSHRSATLSGGVQAAELDPPAMRQAIAWELVLRDIREAEVGQPGAASRELHVCCYGTLWLHGR